MKYESDRLYAIKKGNRSVVVRRSTHDPRKFAVDFFYNGFPDYEWKRGSGGIAGTICDTLEQAKRKANYYISKEQ